MPYNALVQIVVRMYSIGWLVQGLAMLGTSIFEFDLSFKDDAQRLMVLGRLLPGVALLLFAVVSWVAAPMISKCILGGQVGELAISGLSREDLYAFAFLFLGLSFFLGSIGSVLNWLHYFLVNNASTPSAYELPRQPPSYYGLSSSLITAIAGALCIFKGRSWAGKLARAGK